MPLRPGGSRSSSISTIRAITPPICYNTSTIAYNGEIDPQKQAADKMQQAMAEEGLRLIRIVGPQTAHKYHPDSKMQIAHMLDAIAERGTRSLSAQLKFTTWTLAYNRMKWVDHRRARPALGTRPRKCRDRR